MSPTTLRIDSRLVHGQVVETWLPALRIDSIVVVDEGTAMSRLAKGAMQLALPPNVTLTVVDPNEADRTILGNDERVLVLVASVEMAVHLVEHLEVAFDSLVVNVGVVHDRPGTRPITPGIHLSEEEIDLLAGLAEQGFNVEVRGLPSHSPLAVEEARTRYLEQGGPGNDL